MVSGGNARIAFQRAICSLPIEPYAHCPLSHMLIAHWAICSLPIEPYAHCLSSHMLLFPPEYIFLIFSDLASRFPAFINCNSRHLAGSHPKKVDCQAKVVPSLFTGYGPLDRQESGRILCQDRICHHHSQSRLVSDTLNETLPFLECILRLKSNFIAFLRLINKWRSPYGHFIKKFSHIAIFC